MDKIENALLEKIFSDKADSDTDQCPMPTGIFPKNTPVAMAYVPYQQWETPYEAEVALSRGTIFPSLDKPFIGEEAVNSAYTK